uniref:Coatomer subunit zeta n=1 Tax=Aquila chrysaetos chrysaetos TaxID=223781 RepID=A0A663E8F5_AQUCH
MEPAGPEPSLYTVKALLILDSLGQRLLAKGRSPVWKDSPSSTGAASTSSSTWWGAARRTWKEVEKRWLLDNMEGTFLVVDEIVDRGVILESDPQQVIQRLSLRVSAAILCHGLPPPSSASPPPSSASLSPSRPQSRRHTASSSSTTWQAARSEGTQGTPASTNRHRRGGPAAHQGAHQAIPTDVTALGSPGSRTHGPSLASPRSNPSPDPALQPGSPEPAPPQSHRLQKLLASSHIRPWHL